MALEFKEIDNDTQWDDYVLTMPNYSFLNSSARYRYNESVGAYASRVAIFRNSTLLGIISISVGHSRLFGNFLECKHSPSLRENNLKDMQEILDYLKSYAKKKRCFMFRLSPLIQGSLEWQELYKSNSLKKAPIHNVDALISQHINLENDLEDLRRSMSKTKRNLLNRLLKNPDVKVQVYRDNSQFEIFKDFHEQTVRFKDYTDKPTPLLLKELEEQIKRDMFYLFIGYYKGKPIGFWQCTVYGENMHLYQAGSDFSFRDKNINISYILFWEALKLGKELNCKTLDLFGGVVPENYEGKDHPWKGINDFKQSLGGKKVTYMHSRDYPIKRVKYFIYYCYSAIRTKLKGYTIDW